MTPADLDKYRAALLTAHQGIGTPSAGAQAQQPGIPAAPQVRGNVARAPAKLGSVSTRYGGSTAYEKFHPAIDIAGPSNEKIPAFTGGTVTGVRTGVPHGGQDFGNYVIITDPYGNKHRYSHLNQAWVKVGQQISAGTPIGAMGNTGKAYSLSGGTGTHLDYRIKNAAGKYLDPTSLIKKYGYI